MAKKKKNLGKAHLSVDGHDLGDVENVEIEWETQQDPRPRPQCSDLHGTEWVQATINLPDFGQQEIPPNPFMDECDEWLRLSYEGQEVHVGIISVVGCFAYVWMVEFKRFEVMGPSEFPDGWQFVGNVPQV